MSNRFTDRQGRIRLGMVGGGEGAFIGAVHRIAARIDGHYELVAGALSSDRQRAARSAETLGLDPARSYADFDTMAVAEATRPDGIEAVAIVTPNHMHAPAIRAFVEAGIHIICDKPLTTTVEEARDLQRIVRASGVFFGLTHTYTGYPMIRQAREMIRNGDLGDIRVVQVEYAQEWLATKLEDSDNKQAAWRTDPARSGLGGCIGDIGTHAFNLTAFVTGLELVEMSADLSTFVPGRLLDDNVQVTLRYAGGARGALWASQVAVGSDNEVSLRIFGSKGSLAWSQRHANELTWMPLGRNREVIARNGVGSLDIARQSSRVPAGHPEGYLEAFGNLYADTAEEIIARRAGGSRGEPPMATIDDGVAGLAFIDAAIQSSSRGGAWIRL
jgi:predicted dehydrogenase